MYYRILDNKIYDYADYKYAEDCSGTNIITQAELDAHPNKVIVKNGKIALNPNYEQEETTKREQDFNSSFFLTSLGYIRRSVTMSDGGKKDFLSDLLPVISMGVQSGQEVKIIAYTQPDFTHEVTDWTQYQHVEIVTPQFIQECFSQLSNDFLPDLEGENE